MCRAGVQGAEPGVAMCGQSGIPAAVKVKLTEKKPSPYFITDQACCQVTPGNISHTQSAKTPSTALLNEITHTECENVQHCPPE